MSPHCFRCNEILASAVPFCPFCGAEQRAAQPADTARHAVATGATTPDARTGTGSRPVDAAAIGPGSDTGPSRADGAALQADTLETLETQGPTARSPAARPGPSGVRPSETAATAPRPPGETPGRAPPVRPGTDAAPAVPPDLVRTPPLAPGAERIEPAAPASAPRPDQPAPVGPDPRWSGTAATQPRRVRPPNPNRGAAIRKLAAAAFVLLCATILWRQLVVTPHGTILVHLSRPANGSVLVDGVPSGSPDSPIPVSPGRHRIGFDASGFSTPERTLTVRAGQKARLALAPEAKPAELLLDSTPSGAAILIDGRGAGRTPLRRTLAPGRHRIVATASGMQATEREIELKPGDSTALTLSPTPLPLRRVRLDAPAGQWSEPVQPGANTRFTLLFRDPIRVRIAGRVVLLQPGAPVELGAADNTGISVTAAGSDAVPVQLLIATPDGETN